eukprot:scaffold99280_cov22-Phaeocystis_antarctica.AAC.1
MSWWAVPILLLAVGAAAPCAVAVARIDYVEGLLPMMPVGGNPSNPNPNPNPIPDPNPNPNQVGDAATASFVDLQQQFG